uniref:Myosin N-terminal SH3-like domain-containing protein n=1 Tax=Romanomermis culicivorax TaxID=13658 RepID=A0A915HNT7_ROMCU
MMMEHVMTIGICEHSVNEFCHVVLPILSQNQCHFYMAPVSTYIASWAEIFVLNVQQKLHDHISNIISNSLQNYDEIDNLQLPDFMDNWHYRDPNYAIPHSIKVCIKRTSFRQFLLTNMTTGEMESDPGWQYLRQDKAKQLEDQTKKYDSKKNVWISDADEGYIAAEIKSAKGDMVTVVTTKGDEILDLNRNLQKECFLRDCRWEAISSIPVASVLLSKKSYHCRGSASRVGENWHSSTKQDFRENGTFGKRGHSGKRNIQETGIHPKRISFYALGPAH